VAVRYPAATTALALLTACGASQIDPTEQSFTLWLHNDTGVEIKVLQCVDAHCHHFGDTQHVKPAARGEADTSSEAVANPVLFELADGSIYGCLPLIYNSKPHPKPTVQISSGKGHRC
jgi:hypothetical protein